MEVEAAIAGAAVLEIVCEAAVEVGCAEVGEEESDDEDLVLVEDEETAAEGVETAVMMVTVEYGNESSVVVALLAQQSSPWPVVPCKPAQHQLFVSPLPAPPQSWMRVFSLLPP